MNLPPLAPSPFSLMEIDGQRLSRETSYATDASDDRWLDMLFSFPSSALVKNVTTRWGLVRSSSVSMPVTINSEEYANSYVCSPYCGCILYPLTEIRLLPSPWLRGMLGMLIRCMAPGLRMAKVNRTLTINNWLLSTNLYRCFEPSLARPLTRNIVAKYPAHAIAFRSLNPKCNAPLLKELESMGYDLLPSRQVYFFDGQTGDFATHSNVLTDRRLLQNTDYQIVTNDDLNADDASRIEALYRMLYVDKYSEHNPQFTAEWFEQCRQRRLLKMWGLRNKDGILDGIVGVFDREQVATTPLVGYDTHIPQKVGLYRMLMSMVMTDAIDRKLLLNLSSGAAHFKKLRGGEPCLEYTAVYSRHLAWPRKNAWKLLAVLLKQIGAPVLRKYQL